MFSTAEQVTDLKARSVEWKLGGYRLADPMLIPVLDYLVRLPNLATVFSCEGHPEKEVHSEFYVMLAVERSGMDRLSLIYERVKARLIEVNDMINFKRNLAIDFRLTFTSRIWGWGPIPFKPYNVVILSSDTRTEQQKTIFFRVLLDILAEMDNEGLIPKIER